MAFTTNHSFKAKISTTKNLKSQPKAPVLTNRSPSFLLRLIIFSVVAELVFYQD